MNAMLLASGICLLLQPSGSPAFAQSVPELSRFIEDEISAVRLDEAPEAQPTGTEDTWFYRRFWLRVRGKAGIDMAGLTELQIVPEVELLWQRDLPKGWSAYKP